MNDISELFQNISDAELKQAITEMKEDYSTGIIRNDSILRKYAKSLNDKYPQAGSGWLFLVEQNLLKQAAFRFAENKNTYSETDTFNMVDKYDREFKLNTFAYTKPCTFTVEEWFDENKKK